MATIAGLMSESKYSRDVIRVGDLGTNAPHTMLRSRVEGTVVQLPLPQNLQSSLTADWQQDQVSVFRYAMMHGGVDAVLSIKDQIMGNPAAGAGIMTKAWESMKQDVEAIKSRTKSRSSQVGGLKIAMNPRNEMLFRGMGFKSYSFVFSLVPLKKEDSDAIQKAIRDIQRSSIPSLRGMKMFMEYPDTWDITFHEGNEYLMKINECCCTRIDVNYSPNGASHQLHRNNAPVAVELSLDFTEIVIPTRENIEEYNG